MSSSPEAASSPASMSEINYAALAKAGYVEYRARDAYGLPYWEDVARAVVAAYEQQLRDQGMVVVPESLVRERDLMRYEITVTRDTLRNERGSVPAAMVVKWLDKALDAATASPDGEQV